MQKQVSKNQPIGICGQKYDGSPARVTVYRLSGKAEVGNACTAHVGEGIVQKGGTGSFKGILVSPKTITRPTLESTLVVPEGAFVDIADKGRWCVVLQEDSKHGDGLVFDTTTGIISSLTVGEAVPKGCVQIERAIVFIGADAGGVGVIQLD